MSRVRAPYADIFAAQLQKYREDNYLSVEALAETVQRPFSTVYKWTRALRSPSLKELTRICGVLGLELRSLTHPDVAFSQLFGQKLFGFESLNERYQEVRRSSGSVLDAFISVGAAGVMAHRFLAYEGVRSRLEVTFGVCCIVTIYIADPELPFKIEVIANDESGIVMQSFSRDNVPVDRTGQWVLLNEASLRRAARTLLRAKQDSRKPSGRSHSGSTERTGAGGTSAIPDRQDLPTV